MKHVTLLIAVSLIPRMAGADDDPSAAKHAAVVAAIAKQPCLPPQKIVVDKKQKIDAYYSLSLNADGTTAVVCASEATGYANHGANQSPFACFSVDPKSGALAAQPTKLFPGNSYTVPSACALGYCRPKESTKPDEHGDLLAFSSDGARVARISRASDTGKLEIYDAKTKALQRSVTLEGGLAPADVIVHGDYAFVAAYAAGPDGGVWMYSASKGKSLGVVGQGTGEDARYVNISGGSYQIVDDRLVVSDGGYEEATVDLTSGKITVRSLPKPAACTDDAWQSAQSFDIIGAAGGDKPPAKCVKAIRAAQKTFWKPASPPKPDAGFTPAGDKRYKLKHDAKGAALQVFDANAKKPRTVKLATCKVK